MTFQRRRGSFSVGKLAVHAEARSSGLKEAPFHVFQCLLSFPLYVAYKSYVFYSPCQGLSGNICTRKKDKEEV